MGYTPPYLEVRKAAGQYNVYGPSSTTTDDLFIYPNTTDAYSRLEILGNSGSYLRHPAGSGFYIASEGTAYFKVTYSTPDIILNGYLVDKNLFLQPTGTGQVKFGTYTAGAATDSTGYITILDAGGNTRKLMVQA